MKKQRVGSSLRGQRRALWRNQVVNLILHGSITTTEARAKVLKSEVEHLISRAKKADLATRRWVLSLLPDDQAAKKLFDQVVLQFMQRVGGYVRVVKLMPRRGDQASMARVEFVEEIKIKEEEKGKEVKKTKLRKKSGGKKDEEKDKSDKSK